MGIKKNSNGTAGRSSLENINKIFKVENDQLCLELNITKLEKISLKKTTINANQFFR